ncbi:MAG: glycosyltransferase family 4 protein [Myxococcota bacterium]|nr:glycosyltransferase family 4 protein [Myxococcota bacterium]
MRIALVVEKFSRSGGGVEYAVWQLAQAFRAAGDDVHVIAREGEEQDGTVLHRVSVPTFWQPIRVLMFSRAASRVINQNAFDVVHAFSPTRDQDVLHAGGGSHAAYLKHGYGPVGAWLRRLSPRHRVRLHLEKAVVRDTRQKIQCGSHQGKGEFESLYPLNPERLFVVPYGVDVARFSPDISEEERNALREKWGGDAGTVWLFPGSGFRRKGLDTALLALAATRDTGARLWVVGKDDTRRWERRAQACGVASRVHFLGHRNDMEKLYAAADGMILPTRYDAWGLVCLEAAASARPVITSAQCGASEMLMDVARVVERADDAKAFAAALDHFSDPDSRAMAGKEGRAISEKNGWDRCAYSLRAAYMSILQERVG